jgi:hypothetical protein
MSNHYSAAYLRFPGDDARLDFTDLYAFSSPGDAAKTILIMDVNPYTTGISAMPPFLMRPGGRGGADRAARHPAVRPGPANRYTAG